jgi:putative CocE/NonD family hydrolase
MLNRTPYSIGPYGDAYKGFWNSHYMAYFREGYIIVLQDVRGRYMSEGQFVDVRPYNPAKKGKEIDEASDTYDTIDWLIHNTKNNNGRVGMWGISYPGFYATEGALCGHPALKAVSPQAPVTDWFMGDDFHHNGAFMMMDAFSFYSGFGKPRLFPTIHGATGFQYYTVCSSSTICTSTPTMTTGGRCAMHVKK